MNLFVESARLMAFMLLAQTPRSTCTLEIIMHISNDHVALGVCLYFSLFTCSSLHFSHIQLRSEQLKQQQQEAEYKFLEENT